MACIQVLSGLSRPQQVGRSPQSIGEVAGGVLVGLLLMSCCPAGDGPCGRSSGGPRDPDWTGCRSLGIQPHILVWLSPADIDISAPGVYHRSQANAHAPSLKLTEVSAPVQEQRARYEARAPQSEPMDFVRANIQESNLIYKVNPVYPEQAKREGIQGTVKLTIVINEEGFVYEVKGNPGNNPVLEQAAIPAVKRWRFSPFLVKGVPVAMETTATVNFALK